MKGPSRMNLFLWRVRHEAISTAHFLFSRHLSPSCTCGLYNESVTDHMHDFRDCTWARCVWRILVHPDHWVNLFSHPSTLPWIDANLSRNMGVFTTILDGNMCFVKLSMGYDTGITMSYIPILIDRLHLKFSSLKLEIE